eukprot:TRINITY_DN3206_c0_g2_i1.p1 TRINITY_DN3206_c0_g2~~TRINITY_DN3206_c0_g2_i1.p1  ORF type:complete len:1254 (+),score=301.48 TRINITY_DN3206_c0_g2_i1:41-3802(+)
MRERRWSPHLRWLCALSSLTAAAGQCSDAGNCSGNAQGVAFDGTGCQCTCSNGWAPGFQAPSTYGDCSACSSPYALGVNSTCNACDATAARAGFPACGVCTTANDCSANAASVTSDGYLCVCACRNQWSGADCSVCPAPYSTATDCSCTNQWTGTTCAVCPAGFGPQDRARYPSGDCDGCDENNNEVGCTRPAGVNQSRASFSCPPSVSPVCSSCDAALDCSSHQQAGTAVGSDGYRCLCTCRNRWSDADCGQCAAPYGGSDCDGCQVNYTGCLPDRCGVGVNETCSVSGCLPLAAPTCRLCSSTADCSGHASAATSDGYKCLCTCENQWGGPNRMTAGVWGNPGGTDPSCSSCPVPYGPQNRTRYPSSNCDGCQEGWVGCPSTAATSTTGGCCAEVACAPMAEPQCRPCSVADDCNGNARTVDSDGYRCICRDPSGPDFTCLNRWEPPGCRVCPAPYGGSSCDGCLAGQVGCAATDRASGGCCALTACPSQADPQCRPCSSADDCSDHASSVTSDGYRCTCTCRNLWTGPGGFGDSGDCGTCPPPYGGDDCDGCQSPMVGCAPKASITACPRSASPSCRVCTTDYDCSGNAFSVLSDGYRCLCKCRNAWSGADCSQCVPPLGGADCNGCIAGYVGCAGSSCPVLSNPQCRPCGSATDCSGHAAPRVNAATGENPHWITSDGYACNCTCLDGWAGTDAAGREDCGECLSPFAGAACDRCEIGYKWVQPERNASVAPAPASCVLCSSVADCSAHDVNGTVTSDGKTCCCTCRNAWDGPDCSVCQPELFAGDDCGQCAAVAEGSYPLCSPQGTVTVRAQGSCPAGMAAADLVVDCSDRARAAARFYYGRRYLSVTSGPEVLWYHEAIGLPDESGSPAPGCLRRATTQELDTLIPPRDPDDLSHVRVCQVTGYGLLAEYFPNTASSCGFVPLDVASRTPSVVRTEQGVSQTLTYGPWQNLTFADSFAARWVGYFNATDSGPHSFALGSDEGSQLWVDGELVVDNGVPTAPANAWDGGGVTVAGSVGSCHTYIEKVGRVGLETGLHHVALRYFENEGLAGVSLRMRGPRTCGQLKALPKRALRPLAAFVVSYATETQTPTTTPTVTPMDLCSTLPWSTFCSERYQRRMSGTPWVMMLLVLLVCCAACCVPALSRRKAADGGLVRDESPPGRPVYFDPPALPDTEDVWGLPAVHVRVSPQRLRPEPPEPIGQVAVPLSGSTSSYRVAPSFRRSGFERPSMVARWGQPPQPAPADHLER